MGAIITDGDVDYIRSMCPELDINFPTSQQETLIVNYFRGRSIQQAAAAAGYKNVRAAREYIDSPSGQQFIRLLKDREFTDVRMDMETITSMFMEAYNLAATAMEKIAATRELGKLHGLYPDQRKGTEITINQNNVGDMNAKTVMRLTDAQLAEMGGAELMQLVELLNPQVPEVARIGEIIDVVLEPEVKTGETPVD